MPAANHSARFADECFEGSIHILESHACATLGDSRMCLGLHQDTANRGDSCYCRPWREPNQGSPMNPPDYGEDLDGGEACHQIQPGVNERSSSFERSKERINARPVITR